MVCFFIRSFCEEQKNQTGDWGGRNGEDERATKKVNVELFIVEQKKYYS